MASKKKVVEEVIVEDIRPSTLDELMGDRFDIYAKDVIQDRAIPDARDGMKPVQRRIIYAMYRTGNTIEKPTKKCAHIVGEVMGKYHPHGDTSIYEALVRMSQTWRVRLPLVDFQGNNGSMDGDGPAAYRYTEARLAAVSRELVADLDKETVDMGLTFDDTDYEPTVLPARFPNLFVNGATGIAVGMATDIPPHNLREITAAVIYRIQHPNCPIETLMRLVPGPDFPTGGIIHESQGLQDMYLTGRGKVEILSKTEIVDHPDGYKQIVITEIPYGVVKSRLVFEIDRMRHDKVIAGIDEVRDETDKSGLRIVVDLKKGVKAEAVLAFLFLRTPLKSNYSANMVAIVDGRPQTLNLLSYCDTYIAHQVDVVTRRCRYDLVKNESRLEIVDGLIKAASVIEEVIRIIRASKDKADSKANLEKAFGFTPAQSEAIVMMPLYKLSHFDVDVVIEEGKSLREEIAELKSILSSREKLDNLIIADLRANAKTYGDDRRTEIREPDEAIKKPTIDKRDLIAKETVMVAVSRDGYVKRSSLASWKGSGGNNGAYPGLKEGDTLVFSAPVESTDFMLMFTTHGNYIYVPVHLLKANKWLEEGLHINYAVSLDPKEKIVKAFAVHHFREDLNIVLVTRKGHVKRMALSSFPVIRFNRPIRAIRMLTDDQVSDVALTSGNSNLLVVAEGGYASMYNENCVTITSPGTGGVKAGSFHGTAPIAVLSFLPEEKSKVVLITDLAHTRVLNPGNVAVVDRTGKSTLVCKSFKSEPHLIRLAVKLETKEPPVDFDVTMSDGSHRHIVLDDLSLTPMDRYAKKTEKLPCGVTVATLNVPNGLLINDDIVALEPPHKDEPVEELETVETNEEEAENMVVVKGEENRPVEKYEQISIFDDED